MTTAVGSTPGRLATTVCPFCGSGCRLFIEGGSAFPLLHHEVSRGTLCLLGWSTGELLSSPRRVTGAYWRSRGQPLRSGPPDSILSAVGSRLRELRDTFGGERIGILGSTRLTVEEVGALRRLALALRTPHLDSLERWGYLPLPPAPHPAVADAPGITVLGADLTHRHPQMGRRVLEAIDRGAEVRFVQSRSFPLSRLASRRHEVLPGREIEFVGIAPRDHVFLVSSEPGLCGLGGEAMRALSDRRAITLTDTVNQRGATEAGLRPAARGLSAWEMLHAGADGRLCALVVFGDDPFTFFPALTAEAMARLKFVVVVDAVKSPTAARADAVLPGAILAEKRGRVVSGEGYMQEVAPVAVPPAGWTEGMVAELLADHLDGAVQPGPPEDWRWGGEAVPLAPPSDAFPFVIALDTGTYWSRDAYVNATVTAKREAALIHFDHPSGFVSMHPEDRKHLRLSLASPLSIVSERGSVSLPVRTDPDVLPGTLWVPMSEWERTGTALGALGFDSALRIPVFRPTPVRVAPSDR